MEKIKLLIICGPTATGKTKLGIELCQKFNGEIISADSRQIYKDMTIGTGKEYSKKATIWGYDLVNPNEEFSVSHFAKFAKEKIADITSRGKLPIVVGGTGLYIKALTENIDSLDVPPNNKLRDELSTLTVEDLYKKLYSINKDKALSLNDSDKKNPRRLIRAIEVSTSPKKPIKLNEDYDTLIVGLTSNLKHLLNRVSVSVDKRINESFENEVISLLNSKKLGNQAKTATGYLQFISYMKGEIDKKTAIDMWKLSEHQYVKRQLTWFKKTKNIKWFDILETNLNEKVEQLVNSWNNNTNAKKD